MTVWPSGLRRCVKAAVRKGVGSNPTAVTFQSMPWPVYSMAQAYLAILGLFQPSIAQLVEHLTVDQMVPGSIPGRRIFVRLAKDLLMHPGDSTTWIVTVL